jgi:hypothetical protein
VSVSQTGKSQRHLIDLISPLQYQTTVQTDSPNQIPVLNKAQHELTPMLKRVKKKTRHHNIQVNKKVFG